MFRAFNLDCTSFKNHAIFRGNFSYYKYVGDTFYSKHDADIKSNLNKYVCENNHIDVDALEADWFPNVNADIFISYAHEDNDFAVALMGWFKQECNVNAFVDSCIWRHSKDLLHELDERYCKNDDKCTYKYVPHNNAAANVHLIVSNALMKMIYNTPFIIFLNTPESISTIINNDCSSVTNSPWIYSEIMFTKYLAKRHREIFAKCVQESNEVKFDYMLDLGHMTDITLDELNTIKGNNIFNKLYSWKKRKV